MSRWETAELPPSQIHLKLIKYHLFLVFFLSYYGKNLYCKILKHIRVKNPKKWTLTPSMTRDYCSFGHLLMPNSTELNHSRLKNRAFQILEAKSNKWEFRKQLFHAHTWRKGRRVHYEERKMYLSSLLCHLGQDSWLLWQLSAQDDCPPVESCSPPACGQLSLHSHY